MKSIVSGLTTKTMMALVGFTTILFFSNILLAATHTIEMSAETLPNGQFGYQLNAYAGPNQLSPTSAAIIPGPTLFVKQGDELNITLTNNTSVPVGLNIPGIHEGAAEAAANGGSQNYVITANQLGAHPYFDEGSQLLGLFGALVVDNTNGTVQSYVDGDGTIIAVNQDELAKEYIMYMVGSTFWGAEIINGTQTPLWTNPVLGAVLDDIVRFHVLSVEHDHTFHLHAHRWLDEIAPADQGDAPHIIDVKFLGGQADSHSFIVKAGTGADVGPGMWHLHCHVVSHMESGMAARFHVSDPNDQHAGLSTAGASPSGAIFLNPSDAPGLVTFEISDEPGQWFRSTRANALAPVTKTRSLEIIPANRDSSVHFIMSDTNAVHTITTLLWPSDAAVDQPHTIPFDQSKAYRGGAIVKLNTPGLYVFTCKTHPYMFAGVIVDSDKTTGLDLGKTIDLITGIKDLPTISDLATRLLRTFFVATTQENWQDYTSLAPWTVSYPDVPVAIGDLNGNTVDNVPLKAVLESRYGQNITLEGLFNPTTPGIGEVWIDTQFEKTAGKTKPGTITVLDAATWTIKRKIALPEINMNHPHNIWSNADQSVMYQTQWFDNKLTTIDRETGALINNIQVGDSPSHVMTIPGTDEITVAINGENGVVRFPAGATNAEFMTPTQLPGQTPAMPHGHWITPNGQIVTPNINTGDTGIYDGNTGAIIGRPATGGNFPTGPHPIAIGMGVDKFYVTNLLDHSINVIGLDGTPIKTINLIADYDPVNPTNPDTLKDRDGDGLVTAGVLPIQTPVDPTGRIVVTANTGGTITIIDTTLDKVVAMLPCDPGCHGANFGAKAGGGYYAYVTSKFSNQLIVVDVDLENPANSFIAGRIALVADSSVPSDDTIVSLAGTGGQGVYAVPNVYNGWVQNLGHDWGLTTAQLNPVP